LLLVCYRVALNDLSSTTERVKQANVLRVNRAFTLPAAAKVQTSHHSMVHEEEAEVVADAAGVDEDDEDDVGDNEGVQ
jgi:hypothetical protein